MCVCVCVCVCVCERVGGGGNSNRAGRRNVDPGHVRRGWSENGQGNRAADKLSGLIGGADAELIGADEQGSSVDQIIRAGGAGQLMSVSASGRYRFAIGKRTVEKIPTLQ